MLTINRFLLLFEYLMFTNNMASTKDTNRLIVMSFNIWQSGENIENGLQKIIAHIKHVNPDILALQEVNDKNVFDKILSGLGSKWSGCIKKDNYPDTGIVTRHTLIKGSISYVHAGIGAKIKLITNNASINFWNMHLDWKSYGPYAAFNKLATSPDQILAGEYGRFSNIRELLVNRNFERAVKEAFQVPLLVCGDFNSPSHLDWTNKTRNQHGGWAFNWPSTSLLQSETGLKDSFREIHQDPIKEPGITWSTVEKATSQGWNWTIPEPQDRIDFILYKSNIMSASDSRTYAGTLPIVPRPNHYKNDYPSDHYAVITTFSLI